MDDYRYASSLENKRADLFERPDNSPTENNGLLASGKHIIQFFFILNAIIDALLSHQLKHFQVFKWCNDQIYSRYQHCKPSLCISLLLGYYVKGNIVF